MKNKFIVGIIAVVGISMVLTGCGGKNKLKDYNYMTSAYINYGEDKYEINKCIDEDTVIIVKNNEIDKVINKAEFVKPTEILELPESDEKFNLNEKQKVMNMTWETTLDECRQYINYLEERGYAIEFQANTEAFIEIYMKNTKEQSGATYKRLVITSENLIEADVDNILFKNADNYII